MFFFYLIKPRQLKDLAFRSYIYICFPENNQRLVNRSTIEESSEAGQLIKTCSYVALFIRFYQVLIKTLGCASCFTLDRKLQLV